MNYDFWYEDTTYTSMAKNNNQYKFYPSVKYSGGVKLLSRGQRQLFLCGNYFIYLDGIAFVAVE